MIKCAACGAPLPAADVVADGVEIVTCPFCRAPNRIGAAPPVPRAPEREPEPELTPEERAARLRVAVAAGRKATRVIAVVILVLVGAVAALVLVPVLRRSDESAAPRVQDWSIYASMNNLCLFDANRDGALDVAGTGTSNAGSVIVALDGKTGALLWLAPHKESNARLHCRGDAVLLVSDETFRLERLDPAAGKVAWTTTLPDRVESVSGGNACVSVRTFDKKTTTIDWATGKPAACVITHLDRSGTDPTSFWANQGASIAGITITVAKTTVGTPRFVVEGTKGGQSIWKKTLAMTPSSAAEPEPAPDGILLGGNKPGDEKTSIVMYVRASDGEPIFTHQEANEHFAISTLRTADGKAFVLSGNGVVAFELATGRVLWRTAR